MRTEDYWRAIVLYGVNVATYKIALGSCLIDFATDGTTTVSREELAHAFFHRYRERLATGKPQLQPSGERRAVLERAVDGYTTGTLSEEAAIAQVAREGFTQVVPRFHTVNRDPLPLAFYQATPSLERFTHLTLTDELLATFVDGGDPLLVQELLSRWDLLEAAFEMRLPVEVLGTDMERIYRTDGHDRRDITGTRPVLNGYQNGTCFYCGDALAEGAIHVDHLIPRTVLDHDQIWNLVLAHAQCNLAKSARLPSLSYLERLWERNEFFIGSHHPIRQHLLQQTGRTREQRRAFLNRTYEEAKKKLIHEWAGPSQVHLPPNPLAPLQLMAST